MPDNSTDVKVGKLIAMIVDKGDDWKSVEVPKSDEKAESSKGAEEKKTETKEKKTETKEKTTEKKEKSASDKEQTEQSQYVLFK
jgi:pyruvate/2-oxoglutarate dehydrogenase complex dihydrolipoamide acyltransferase (E2) component